MRLRLVLVEMGRAVLLPRHVWTLLLVGVVQSGIVALVEARPAWRVLNRGKMAIARIPSKRHVAGRCVW